MKLQGSDLEGGGRLIHGLPPFIPHFCKILILGSMPSEASLKAGFYYAHPQNRFFRIIGDYLGRPLSDLLSRQQALNELGIGLFDVIASCYRQGSLDKSIVDPTVNNLTDILLFTKILDLVEK